MTDPPDHTRRRLDPVGTGEWDRRSRPQSPWTSTVLDRTGLFESLAKKCLVDNNVPVHPESVERVTAVFRKAGKRVFTPALRAELQALGVQAFPRAVSHAEVVRAAVRAGGLTTLARCATAFVAGLESDLAALRAPLRAFAVVAHFPDHRPTNPKECRTCGYNAELLPGEYCAADTLSALPTCGIHGGVDEAYAAAQVLDWFSTLPPVVPTREQVGRFERVLGVIAQAPAKATCNSLHKDLSGPLGGDKYHRLYVIETLGYCGVLHTGLGEPLLDKWVDRRAIQEHPSKFNEAESPACFWKREFGFNGARFRELFPAVALPARLDGPMA